MQIDGDTLAAPLACVEVGGGGVQTIVFDNGSTPRVLEGAHQPNGAAVAFAVPGVIAGGVVREASNLGWRNIDPVRELGLRGPALLVLNDAEAAALGEAALRGTDGPVVFVTIGTGIGGAVVDQRSVLRANLFGHNAPDHGTRFGDLRCRCGREGCLETVAAGWALPDPLDDGTVEHVAELLARAIDAHPLATEGIIVVGGGIARRYPELIDRIAAFLPRRTVEASKAPATAKSAAAWGLRHELLGAV
jgi:predicted NBD/HSP70 family sugar kinase